jgi:phage repressor protein C with HTH and peptisase S24 domain
MTTTSTQADRLKEALDSLPRGGKAKLAKTLDVTPQAVHAWIKTGSIDKNHLAAIAKITGYELNWLITGESDKIENSKHIAETNQIYSNEIIPYSWSEGYDLWDQTTPLYDHEEAIPFFRNIRLTPGKEITELQKQQSAKMRMALTILRRQGVKPQDAVCLVIEGNNMEPGLPHGSVIAIDTSKTHIITGKMYAINHDGVLQIRMLYPIPRTGLRLRSYNTLDFPDEFYPDASHIRVLGKVFWSSALW